MLILLGTTVFLILVVIYSKLRETNATPYFALFTLSLLLVAYFLVVLLYVETPNL